MIYHTPVDLTKKNLEPPDIANSLNDNSSLDDSGNSKGIDFTVWLEIRNDLIALSEIIKNRNKRDKEEKLSFMAKHH